MSVLLLGIGIAAQAQQATTATGGDAMGSGGTVAYSVGQVVYTTNTGALGTVSQGVQQPFEIQVVLGMEQLAIDLHMMAYPNPTSNVLNLSVGNRDTWDLSYQLFDVAGKLLTESKIDTKETSIFMADYPQANYFLDVIQGNKKIKTFKIIKN